MADPVLDSLCVNTIRCLAIDAVEKAKSGHPGTPLGAAPLAYTLWDRYLKHNPLDPKWPDRDRFVLSAGHASMLLYALLHLTGYDLSLDEIKNFRQLGSRTPGHPEYGLTPGVESTTGPLGQGFANAVGMAMAERLLAARYNRPGFEIFDHHTYALVSDGDLQEGVSSEAASLAGTLQLGKLIFLYDSNDVQQDGPTTYFTEGVAQRFRAYGWNVIGPIEGMDLDTVSMAIQTARLQTQSPNLIICKTVIGFGSPHKAGTNAAHGEPLGEEEVRLTKQNLGWQFEEPFTVPPTVLQHMRLAVARGAEWQNQWQLKLGEYARHYPAEADSLAFEMPVDLPPGWNSGLAEIVKAFPKTLSTRDASGKILNALAEKLPNLVGGSADLAGSTRAVIKGSGDFSATNWKGRNLHFGLREFAMGAISNGLAVHGGLMPFCSTFLIFSDYMRPAIRLAALMRLPVIYIFTHDSIGLGEDGPTHQPVEQLMNLRAIPNLMVIRPADSAETVEAWQSAILHRDGPTALILTRQNVPLLDRIGKQASELSRGGYILWESAGKPEIILIASGSEVQLALSVGKQLQIKGIAARVVSMPCWSLFDSQTTEYRESVLPSEIQKRVSVEAGTTLGWEHYVGLPGIALGVNRFGISAPGEQVYSEFGLTAEKVLETSLKLLMGGRG